MKKYNFCHIKEFTESSFTFSDSGMHACASAKQWIPKQLLGSISFSKKLKQGNANSNIQLRNFV